MTWRHGSRGAVAKATEALLDVTRSAWTGARRKPLGAAGVAILIALAAVAIFADLIATHDPLAQDIDARLQSPGAGFFFGTDTLGRDVFSRVVHGSRISLYVGLVSVTIATVLGACDLGHQIEQIDKLVRLAPQLVSDHGWRGLDRRDDADTHATILYRLDQAAKVAVTGE